MSKVSVSINNRTVQLECDDGEEHRLKELASYFSRHVDQLQGRFGHIGDTRLFIMAGLTISDKLSDALTQIEEIQGEVSALRRNSDEFKGDAKKIEDIIIQDIETLASKLEGIAKALNS
ncbi:MAG: cell division protein ZapA [Rhodobiaceae bacterium]|jgi:cell division protein ZapA|nr:cell division protein ZapA [Rhodobiaceae bacterium]MBT5640848.1 cell division protein ZapA [Rhodobiaceae bacterium]MBT6222525.1 cell division protein ZapA [Rhodobiaceae bacterium]MDB4832033.1 cell division protein ZapA [Hyphomicrobiales bacterium]MDC3272275.1 cell division protein ZapA [Hyphomicrobiales bacterium]|tara:strand:- start:168 stop:524 length:357 start_codon:yes stop_codon:yes gene_type:complete